MYQSVTFWCKIMIVKWLCIVYLFDKVSLFVLFFEDFL